MYTKKLKTIIRTTPGDVQESIASIMKRYYYGDYKFLHKGKPKSILVTYNVLENRVTDWILKEK